MRKPLLLLWALFLIVAESRQSISHLNVDNDLIFEEPHQESGVGRGGESSLLGGLLHRVKRQWLSWFSDKTTPAAAASTSEETPPPTASLPSEVITSSTQRASTRETRSPPEGGVTVSRLIGDDEDDSLVVVGYSGDLGSGEEGKPVEEVTRSPPYSSIYRLTFVVHEPWDDDFRDRTSTKFKSISEKITKDVQLLYEDLDGQQVARLINIQPVDDSFKIKVTVDIGSYNNNDARALEDHIRDKLDDNNRIGEFTVDGSSLIFTPFKDVECKPDEITCSSDPTRCIPNEQRCDGIAQCPEGEDETNCATNPPTSTISSIDNNVTKRVTLATESGWTRTPSGNRALGEEGWNGGSQVEEEDLFVVNGSKCRADDSVRCESDQSIVICTDQKCDNVKDCPNGEDEANCPTEPSTSPVITSTTPTPVECLSTEFKCDVSRCLPESQVCDGRADCVDSTDEDPEYCKSRRPPCSDYTCNDGSCINYMQVCNFIKDCPGGEDEIRCPNCNANEFRCDDNTCIPEAHQCDGRPDCPDSSDERNCPRACRSFEFRCSDGKCIRNEQICDRRNDCDTGEDEKNCPSSETRCLPGEFLCQNGVCILAEYYCDGIPDCTDKSDETNCKNRSCLPSDFRCSSGDCVTQSQRCDGKVDCQDGSDENNCSQTCSPLQFTCNSGQCIPLNLRCDRTPHCQDRSDEEDCEPFFQCQPGEFECSSGNQCIDERYKCDSRKDCRDGSDELYCPSSTPAPAAVRCQSWEFRCHSGDQCVSSSTHCDNKIDCRDGSDEINCAGYPELDLKVYEKDQIIKESREAVFQCRDEGPGRHRTKWTRERGLPLPPNTRDQDGRLEMPNVQIEHTGYYYCEAVGIPPSSPGARVAVHLKVEPLTLPVEHFDQACGPGEATCHNRQCIPKERVCDGTHDCTDGSDETRCRGFRSDCEPNEFSCANKKCILKSWRCDKDDDCGDGTDENDCGTGTLQPGSRCYDNEFECSSRNQCVPKTYHCDQHVDCQDGSDEIGCYPPKIEEQPPAFMSLQVGETLVLTCRASGVPTPLISWRKDWAHVPRQCRQESTNGLGILTCPNMKPQDSGAYSCEALNSITFILAPQDTLVKVARNRTVCDEGTFNDEAQSPEDCISCFCFGITTHCRSADLFIYKLPPQLNSLRVVNVVQEGGVPQVRWNDITESQNYLVRPTRGGFRIDTRRVADAYGHPYLTLPESYLRNQLKSYGGFISYNVRVDESGRDIDIPDIIIIGNDRTVSYKHPGLFHEGVETPVAARLFDKEWSLLEGGGSTRSSLATRNDIMMVLVDVQNILIRAQYKESPQTPVTITNLTVDSASNLRTEQGQPKTSLVEECQCPAGYRGLSCEDCQPGYNRRARPPWKGECVEVPCNCPPGEYGDPCQNVPCRPCPCPSTSPSNRFTDVCYLSSDGNPTCQCPEGYIGRNCESCAPGYRGNPLLPGGRCERAEEECNADGSLSTTPDPSTGQCTCKKYVTGPKCSECAANAFHLSSRNQHGCINCFCNGVSKECYSSNLYRDQIALSFASSEGVNITAEDEDTNYQPYVSNGELIYEQFEPKTYYWRLPQLFLGDKMSSYGGYLSYTIRYVPTHGGQSSRNGAADVKLLSRNRVNLYYFNNQTIEPNQPVTVRIPLLESYWQRENGGSTDRAHMLMALADIVDFDIKATYTTNTQLAGLQMVSLDTASPNNYYGRGHASEVEVCNCPPEYSGDSCQYCKPGYKRADEGLYLRLCEPCSCNGRSSECHPETGECYNCRDNWRGPRCEECPREYLQRDDRCEPHNRTCNCDRRGLARPDCIDGQCICKTNVVGEGCSECRNGTFFLSEEHPNGCLDCYCSGHSSQCQSSNLVYVPLPMILLEDQGHILLTDQDKRDVIRDNFILNLPVNEIGYNFRQSRDQYYWSLPPRFTGNKVTSYGGNLRFSQRVVMPENGRVVEGFDIILNGFGKSIYWTHENPITPNRTETFEVSLSEGKWRRKDPRTAHSLATRREILEVLSQLSSIQIRANSGPDTLESYLSDVLLQVATPPSRDNRRLSPALSVESCVCPPGYSGTSCETCQTHYYRHYYDNTCRACPCNNNERSCSLSSDNRVVCECKYGYSGPYCENRGTMVHLTPSGTLYPKINSRIYFTCNFSSEARVFGRFESIYVSPAHDGAAMRSSVLPMDLRRSYEHSGILTQWVLVEPGLTQFSCKVYDEMMHELGGASAFFVSSPGTSAPPSPRPSIVPPPKTIVVVIEQPTIKIQEVGSTVRYRCSGRSLISQSPLNVRWSKERGRLPAGRATDDYRGNLEIVNVQISDAGTYICTAYSGIGSESQSVSLVVGQTPTLPTVQITPSQANLREGDSVDVSCEATGYPYPSIDWRRADNALLNPRTQISGGLLRIPSVSKRDEGEYECIARNDVGAMSQVFRLIILGSGPPPVAISPPSLDVTAGGTIYLNCQVTSNYPSTRVMWSREDFRPLPEGVSPESNQLIIRNARPEHSGVYVCEAKVPGLNINVGVAQARITVEYRGPPATELAIFPHSQTVPQGLTAELTCGSSTDTTDYQWFKLREQLPSKVQFVDRGRILRIPYLEVRDRGIYICEAWGRNLSATLEVERREQPMLELFPRESRQTALVGSTLLLQCRVTRGIPQPVVVWTRTDNRTLPFTVRQEAQGVLRFDQITVADSGEYMCVAENLAGRASLTVHVEVHARPKIRVSPPDSVVRLTSGQRLKLLCTAEGTPTPSVRWTTEDPDQLYARGDGYSGTKAIFAPPNLSNAELDVFSVTTNDEGYYYCVASSEAGTEKTAVQVIIDDNTIPSVPTEPSSTTYGEDFWVAIGGDTQITCSIDPSRSLRREWVRADGRPLPPGVYQSEDTLLFRAASPEVQGEYVCLLIDPQGREIKRASKYLTVKELPEITLDPPKQVVRPGETASIRCIARGESPIQVTWEGATGRLPANVRIEDNIIWFERITVDDAGRYICKARNVAGLREAAADVIVNERGLSQPRVNIVGDRSRTNVQGSSVTLQCTSDVPARISWRRENGPLPSTAMEQDSSLRIDNVQPSDSGRYICSVTSHSGLIGTNYIDLSVIHDYYCEYGFKCWNGECLGRWVVCDGVRQCSDGSDEAHCRKQRGAHNIRLQIEPSIDVIRVGNTVDLRCITEGIPSSSIVWSKVNGPPLGRNTHVISTNVLRIKDVTTSNAGTYRCSAETGEDSHFHDYNLVVQATPAFSDAPMTALPPAAAKTVDVLLGDSAEVNCQNNLEPPVSYIWQREGVQHLPRAASVNQEMLTLREVKPRDAGLYTCIATNGEVRMNISTFVVVRGTIPKFSQAANSFIKLKTLFDAYTQFDIEILLKPEDPNGLILYNGHRATGQAGGSDFVSLGLRDGYPEFRFDVGSGHATIIGAAPLVMGRWAKIRLHRNRKEGRMIVNDASPVIGTSPGRHQGLDLNLPLYVGSVPDFSQINKAAGFDLPFQGCISRLVINNEEQNLSRTGVLEWSEVEHCDTCADHPCTNSGACQEAANLRGFICLCPRNFSGENCDRTGESCYPGRCGDGTCENTEVSYLCKCPLGLAGSHCEHRLRIRTPAFQGSSYIAYPTPRHTEKLDINLKINPYDSSDGLLLYGAQNDNGLGNYLSLAIKDRRLEFRIRSGAGPTLVLKSNAEVTPGTWMTVNAGRDSREARLTIGDDTSRATLTSIQRRELNLGTPLYLGGFTNATMSVLNSELQSPPGFRGCISDIEVSRLSLDILKSAVDASNVLECSSGNPCSDNPCLNGGSCSSDGAGFVCHCPPEFNGTKCELYVSECERLEPCGRHGICIPLPSGYRCHCAKGYVGQNCTNREYFTSSISVQGDGWVELPRELADTDSVELSLNVLTTSSDGIILWHGQGPTHPGGHKDFFSIAVKDGVVEVLIELGSGLGSVRSPAAERVDDGRPHLVSVSREGSLIRLQVDSGPLLEATSPGFLSKLNARGNIYIGGVPASDLMTGGRYRYNFNGCIRDLRIQNTDVINFYETAISTVNVGKCPL